ncbi:MAG: hypothetical protein ACYSUQ_11745 [Planctomycetota bacterium]
MEGRVHWYNPATRHGRVTTDEGESFFFVLDHTAKEVGGGDLVGFQVAKDGTTPRAVEIQLLRTCVDYLNTEQQALVNQFHSTVAIQR